MTLKVLQRWKIQHRNILLVAVIVSVCISMRISLISRENIKLNHVVDIPVASSTVKSSSPTANTLHHPLNATAASHIPLHCQSDRLGVPPALHNSQCESNRDCLNITCDQLIHGDNQNKSKNSIYSQVVEFMHKYPRGEMSTDDFLELTKDCNAFKTSRGYLTQPLDNDEAAFPLAYNILIHRDFPQVERLLRAIYRPQNSYCIHIDAKAAPGFLKVTKAVSDCFDNVFIANQLEKITYAGFSRLQADINCMKDHLKQGLKWKYLLNLAGQSFPLKTNAEIVQILKIYNGANDIEGIYGYAIHRYRFENEYKEINHTKVQRTGRKNPPPPHDMAIIRGSAYGVFSRDFVQYAVTHQAAIDLLEWSRNTYSPDEHFWATLHHTYSNPFMNPPGGYSGHPNKKPWLAVYVKWGGVDHCYGVFKRGICIFGVADLPDLITRKEFFCNKFYLKLQPVALDCLEAWIQYKTECPAPVDEEYYKSLPFIKKP